MQGFVGVRHDTTCPGLSDSATLPVQHRRAAQMEPWSAHIALVPENGARAELEYKKLAGLPNI